DTSSVLWTYSSTSDEPTIHLEGADYVFIKNMTISNTSSSDAWGIALQNSADHITVDSCLIKMPVGTTSDVCGILASERLSAESAGDNGDYLTVSNCTFIGGQYAIYLLGDNDRHIYSRGNSIVNNI